MKNLALISYAKWLFFGEIKLWNFVAIATLIVCSTTSIAGEDATYLDEGNVLVRRLIDTLIEEHVCVSKIDCRSHGGYAFIKPVKQGVEMSVYGIKSDQVAAKLLQACAGSFATRPLGKEMTVTIYRIGALERNNQTSFSKTPPTFTLKLEKTNVKH